MAEERLRLRHGGHKKWARDMRRFKGKMENKEMREEYHEMMREKKSLKTRRDGVQKTVEMGSSDDGSESEGSEMSESELKKRAIAKIEGEVSEEEESDDENSDSEEDSQEEGEGATISFKKKPENKSKKEDGGLMGMKFMKTAEKNKKERIKE